MGHCRELRKRIFSLFEGKSYWKDMVITIVMDNTQDYREVPQPFLRIVSTPSEHIEEIVEILKRRFNMDIEVLMLAAFHPKE